MTESTIAYGDSSLKTIGLHGTNVSSQRMDNLDIAAMSHALQLKEKRGVAIDVGCGLGMQGLRFASTGFRTILIDWIPIDLTVLRVVGIEHLLPLSYTMKDVRTLTAADLPDALALCYSQRFIHYLRFDEALALLRLLRGKMAIGARLFLSASGLRSELGNEYAGQQQQLESRFAVLAKPLAEKHGIHESVCLYTQDDLIALCNEASFSPARVFSSPFGNVKGVFAAA